MRAGLNAALAPKICASGWKRTLVPRLFGTRPSFSSLLFGMPRSNTWRKCSWPRQTSTSIRSDSAFVDRHADAVQAARGFVGLGVEFAARVQRRHDHFERGLLRKFRMRIDRNAAPVVGHADEAVGLELDLDPVGVAGDRLVHRVVDHFGEQVMQRLLVGAADIHAGAAAHRLQPFQHLDVARRVARIPGATAGLARVSFGVRRRAGAAAAANRSANWQFSWRFLPSCSSGNVGDRISCYRLCHGCGAIVTFRLWRGSGGTARHSVPSRASPECLKNTLSRWSIL